MYRSTGKLWPMAVLGLLAATAARGGELTHGFVNPAFGGNPLNGNYLLSNATAQNNHKPHPKTTTSSSKSSPSSSTSTKTTSAERFQQMVDNLVMSSLANRIVSKAFGTSSLPEMSSVDTGINTISVESTASGTTVTIVDNRTGGRSVITIPNY